MYKLWNELEMNRRIIHFSGVIIPIAYLMGIVSWKFIGVILFILSLIVLKLEYVRLYHGFDNIIYDNLTRTYEADSIAGYALYVIGIFLAWLFYPPIAAISGMLMLSVGDPISGI
jgi:dolichol kinase